MLPEKMGKKALEGKDGRSAKMSTKREMPGFLLLSRSQGSTINCAAREYHNRRGKPLIDEVDTGMKDTHARGFF